MEFVSGSHLLTAQNIPTLLGGAVVAAIVYQIGLAIYNVYFHPLRKYPGPRFYGASRLPYMLDLLHGTLNRTVVEAHKKYGDVIRIAPDELSFISGDTAWQDIYGFRGAKKPEFGKDLSWYSKPPNGIRSMISSGRDEHARVRRIFSHAFSDKALKEQEPLIQRYVDLLVQRLHEKVESGTHVDIVRYYNFTTFDVIGDLTFGEPFGCLETDDYHALVSGVFKSIRALSFFLAIRYSKLVDTTYAVYNKIVNRGKLPGNAIFLNFTRERVNKRLAVETQRPDIITAVERQPESKALSAEELTSNSALFLLAGSETTATMLSGTTYALLKNPRTMKKLRDEIRTEFKSQDEITFERVGQLPYLLAVLNEGLRMYPPVPTGFPRRVPEGGEMVSGHYVPDKSSVYVSQFATYHSERNFAEPNSFIPERWMGNDARFANDKQSVLMPFSNGPRNCLGKNLAYAEMRTILAKTFFRFDLELVDKKDDWFDQRIFTLWEKKPLVVRLTEVSR